MKDQLKKYIVTAQLHEPTDEDYEALKQANKSIMDTADGPIDTNGKPRMLFITAWMAHEGRNLNGDAFVKEELKRIVVDGLFAPPYAGMIDYDHDFTPRGYWYKTSFAYNDMSQKWGILAHGAVWAWRFPELADELLGRMKLEGKIDVSMSTLSDSSEVTSDYPGYVGQKTNILHNPVFFTTSLLSVPPGDPHAKGTVTNDPSKIGEVNMAEQREAEGATPKGMALHKLIFPKAFWSSAEEVKNFAIVEGLGSWNVVAGSGGFELLDVAEKAFIPGSFKQHCIASVGGDCAIIAVVGEVEVDEDGGRSPNGLTTDLKSSPDNNTVVIYQRPGPSDFFNDGRPPLEFPADKVPGPIAAPMAYLYMAYKHFTARKAILSLMKKAEEDKGKSMPSPDNHAAKDDDMDEKVKGRTAGEQKDDTPDRPTTDTKSKDDDRNEKTAAGPVDHPQKEVNKSPHIKDDGDGDEDHATYAKLKAEIAEVRLALTAAMEAKAKTEKELEDIKALLKAKMDKDEEEKETAKLAARLAELPEAVRAHLEKNADKDIILSRWKKASDEEWTLIRSSLSVGLGYTERSAEAGVLPLGGGAATQSLKSYLKH